VSGTVIGFMVDDLVEWLEAGFQPTGIQRVIVELMDTARARSDIDVWPGVSAHRPNDSGPGLVEVDRGWLNFGTPTSRGSRAVRTLTAARAAFVRLPLPSNLRAAAKVRYGRLLADAKAARVAAPTRPVDVLAVPGSFWFKDMPERMIEFAGAGTPVRMVVYDLIPLTNPEWWDPTVVDTFRAALDQLMPVVERVVTMSQKTTDALLARYPEAVSKVRIAVPDLIAHAPRVTPHAGLPAGVVVPFLLALGTVEPRKNHRLILDAWRLAKGDPRLAGASLVIAGREGWQTAELEEEIARDAERFSLVRVKGANDSQIESLYAACRATVLASFAEGFGLPARESVARGIRTLMSSAIPPDGLPADRIRLFDPRDPGQLAHLIVDAMTDRNDRMAVALGPGTGWEPMVNALIG
jgi:glycosyltransferase involved in cell wall biosynthesis